MNGILISGFGDIGRRVAAIYLQRHVPVIALVRTREKAELARAMDVQPVMSDLDDAQSLAGIDGANRTVFHFAPPPGDGEADTRVRHLLDALTGNGLAKNGLPRKVVLISTTAVYGDCQGRWVNEDTPPNPQTARGKRRWDSEQFAQHWGQWHNVPVVVLRVGGIYGPRRLPVARLEQGLPILKESISPYTNRIHEDDLARICVAAAQRAPAGAVYNVSDGRPGTMSRYFKDIAAALGLPQPPEVDMQAAKKVLSPGMLSYLKESRRIDNSKLLNELGVALRYPNFATGLQACLAEIRSQDAGN
jgi:nucleoside-diphosphate-sugar epimerase